MTKKQCGIILTLLGLILCVGILSVKLNNGGLNDPEDLSAAIVDQNVSDGGEDETEALSQNDAFYDSRSSRDQNDSTTIQTLKAIIADSNISEEKKNEATSELTKKTVARDNENRIELNIKNKGYEDALCMLEDNKATVIVKSSDELSEKDSVAIQEIVQDVSKIKDVIIQVKQ
ncbi:SpoIIIAH-like family protein [Clostridium sp. BJN0001]|uniref:SpoIIIAH-like family protein n=1 Tax=Clostridium sp. BJN0001 TaxID=2930219 RepID=UPI001FD0293B|nr:SpoIIIAH-like family protein [Clostridium sp. BJN0001]